LEQSVGTAFVGIDCQNNACMQQLHTVRSTPLTAG